MCGRFTLRRPLAEVAEKFAARLSGELFPPPDPLNVSSGQIIPVVRSSKSGDRELAGCLWGLIPSWSKDGKPPHHTVNARCETVATKPPFRTAYKARRCLIPADGFCEPKGEKGTRRTPFYIHMGDGGLMGIAGLWERWRDDAGHAIDSCTILTTDPNEVLAPIHDRMPVIVQHEDYAAWLDPKTPPGRVAALMGPRPPPEGMGTYEVVRTGRLAKPPPPPPQERSGLFG